MAVQYRESLTTTEDFCTLFATTGWNKEYNLSDEELINAVSRNWLLVAAYEGERLIGFGRVISDGVLHAMIYDLIVDPDFQGLGIGTRILTLIVERCRRGRIRDIQLFCARGKRGFYEKLGFRARTEDAPGMEYVAPN